MQLITVTLDDKTSEALDRWLARTASATGPPRLTAEEAIPAMVRVCLGFTDISDLVASHIRAERAAEKLGVYQSRQGPGSLLPGKVVGPLCSGLRPGCRLTAEARYDERQAAPARSTAAR
jgi:hypothetical protein